MEIEVRVHLTNAADRPLPVTIEPFFATRTLDPSDSVECVVTGPQNLWAELDLGLTHPPFGLWLHPQPKATARFVHAEPNDLDTLSGDSGRGRLRGWPLGMREGPGPTFGFYLDADPAGAVVQLSDGSSNPLAVLTWIDGSVQPETPVSVSFGEHGYSISGLDAIRVHRT